MLQRSFNDDIQVIEIRNLCNQKPASGVAWNDPEIEIVWPEVIVPKLSEKHQRCTTLRQAEVFP